MSNEERVRIVQCLCPLRHCIMAVPYQSEDGDTMPTCEGLLRDKCRELIEAGMIRPVCSICAAPSEAWTYEDQPTIFRTMDEAIPALRASERLQAIARAALLAAKN